MKSAPFVRHVPRTVEEATTMLAEFGPQDGRVLAGGQSLVPIMAFRMARPPHLVDINGIAPLGQMSRTGDTLSIAGPLPFGITASAAGRWADGTAARDGGAPHRALSDPHPRYILRQRGARRSIL